MEQNTKAETSKDDLESVGDILKRMINNGYLEEICNANHVNKTFTSTIKVKQSAQYVNL